MDKKELKKKYDKLVAEIESARMYDGRNKGVDLYQCKDCGFQFYTRYKDKDSTRIFALSRYIMSNTGRSKT